MVKREKTRLNHNHEAHLWGASITHPYILRGVISRRHLHIPRCTTLQDTARILTVPVKTEPALHQPKLQPDSSWTTVRGTVPTGCSRGKLGLWGQGRQLLKALHDLADPSPLTQPRALRWGKDLCTNTRQQRAASQRAAQQQRPRILRSRAAFQPSSARGITTCAQLGKAQLNVRLCRKAIPWATLFYGDKVKINGVGSVSKTRQF